MEVVKPEFSVIQFGVENSGCPQLICIKIYMTWAKERSM
jgi:hypothetical protein